VPGSPQGLHVDEIFADRCRLSWKAPQDDGGSEIMGKRIQDVTEPTFILVSIALQILKLSRHMSSL
jgi:hypothetical protein